MQTQPFRRPTKDRARAETELRRFTYEFDPRTDILPKDLDPIDVSRFIRSELERGGLNPSSAHQLVELADFYDRTEIAPSLLLALERCGTDESQFRMALALVRGVGLLGEYDFRIRGRAHLERLFGMPYAGPYVELLLQGYRAYDDLLPVATVRRHLDTILIGLSRKAQQDPTAETHYRQVEDLANNMLPRIVAAAQIKRDIVTEPVLSTRLDRLVNIYLNLDPRYREQLERWAVRQIQREVTNHGAKKVVEAFRRGLGRVAAREAPAEARSAISAVGLRAIEFLGGSLTQEELRIAHTVPGPQSGLLSLE